MYYFMKINKIINKMYKLLGVYVSHNNFNNSRSNVKVQYKNNITVKA